ncbi:hypothetical protein BaRGS_00034112 [Batillaria attramentaria]|uniref:Uncharacterized protein n=1 Tax=Batillaria attramentaria TaxID=370345 RepID=A0ABD0JIV1_9CAEN
MRQTNFVPGENVSLFLQHHHLRAARVMLLLLQQELTPPSAVRGFWVLVMLVTYLAAPAELRQQEADRTGDGASLESNLLVVSCTGIL